MSNHRRIPEHIRLGVKPQNAGVSLLHESGIPKGAGRRQQRIPPPPEPMSTVPVRVAAKPPGEPTSYAMPPFKRGMNSPAAQTDVRVQVGNHEENLWMDGVAGRPQEVIDNNDTIDLRAVQGTAHMNANMGHEQPLVRYPDGMYPVQQQQPEPQQPEPQPVQQQPETIPEGHYGVIWNGELVFVSMDLQQVRTMIETWVLEHQVPIGALTIFKNIPIGFGVILES